MRGALLLMCALIIVLAPIVAFPAVLAQSQKDEEISPCVLTIWQIDYFEGGKGSRASYLEKVGKRFADEKIYVKAIALSADAVRENLSKGVLPDMISYGAGVYGLESYIKGQPPYVCWARGGYCVLTLGENADFSDVTPQNTVINIGTENLTGAAALFCGLESAAREKPTAAYVKLLDGDYKYLLGTQRDIYRLKTRGAAFSVKAVNEFNDLYQNISITATDERQIHCAKKFISALKENGAGLADIGMLGDEHVYADEMGKLEGITYEYALKTPISEDFKRQLDSAIANSDLNLLKSLLK